MPPGCALPAQYGSANRSIVNFRLLLSPVPQHMIRTRLPIAMFESPFEPIIS
jgi:hypothetical protein